MQESTPRIVRIGDNPDGFKLEHVLVFLMIGLYNYVKQI
jgi:hypothetical protein